MKRCLSIVKNEVRLEVPLPIVDLLACFAEAVGVNIWSFPLTATARDKTQGFVITPRLRGTSSELSQTSFPLTFL